MVELLQLKKSIGQVAGPPRLHWATVNRT